jgi:hypothetical protein
MDRQRPGRWKAGTKIRLKRSKSHLDFIIIIKGGRSALIHSHARSMSFLQLSPHIFLTLKPKDEAELLAQAVCNQNFILIPLCFSEADDPNLPFGLNAHLQMTLTDVYLFSTRINAIERQNDHKKLVFYAGYDLDDHINGSFLLGCYMILTHDYDPDHLIQSCRNVDHLLRMDRNETHINVIEAWHAVHHAKTLGWISFNYVQGVHNSIGPGVADQGIDLEEYIHYARFSKIRLHCHAPLVPA